MTYTFTATGAVLIASSRTRIGITGLTVLPALFTWVAPKWVAQQGK